MDNKQQIREILKYKRHLNKSLGIHLDNEMAAKLWILKYASLWRNIHLKNGKNRKISIFYS